jgi:hypothetical protein
VGESPLYSYEGGNQAFLFPQSNSPFLYVTILHLIIAQYLNRFDESRFVWMHRIDS